MATFEPTFPIVFHGGDYNPEQWPREVWDQDVEFMQMAGWTIATLPVFGWGNIQTDEETFNFEWLDTVVEKLHAAGIRICFATATAATPPWVDQKYPDILITEQDGRKKRHGGRHTFCPSSANFKRLSTGLARAIAERYGKHPAVWCWHVSNEYGNKCYCDACSAAFREWLKAKYGSLDEVNQRWNMFFWGQTFTDWSQIEAPVSNGQRNFQGLIIDYDRFQSESILAAFRAEIAVLRELTPQIPITTNMMGSFKPLNYHQWAKHLDLVSWDSYPGRNAHPSHVAFQHSLMRGLKEGQPWMLMEQTPSQQNWQQYNSLKRPGILRLWSFQAMAHGADAIMYFQWRRSPGAQEMFHGAVVEHASSIQARVFREVVALGEELKLLGPDVLGTRVQSQVAILFDWENWWAVEYSSGPSIDLKYVPIVQRVYAALWNLGIVADVVSPDADLSKYAVVIAPALKMVKPSFAKKIEAFTEAGGRFVTTFFSGITDETDRAFLNGYPGPLSKVLGIWVEETDAFAPTETNEILLDSGESFVATVVCDIIQPEGAETVGRYTQNFYAGVSAVTRNPFGSGAAFYIGSHLDDFGYQVVLNQVLQEAKVTPAIAPVPHVEITERRGADGRRVLFLLNHSSVSQVVVLPEGEHRSVLTGTPVVQYTTLDPLGVEILAY